MSLNMVIGMEFRIVNASQVSFQTAPFKRDMNFDISDSDFYFRWHRHLHQGALWVKFSFQSWTNNHSDDQFSSFRERAVGMTLMTHMKCAMWQIGTTHLKCVMSTHLKCVMSTYLKCVMSQIRMTRMKCVMSQIGMTRMKRVMSQIEMTRIEMTRTKCVMSQIGLTHMRCIMSEIEMTHMKESHTWMGHVPHMNESCCTYEWVTSCIWRRQVTHVNTSFRTCNTCPNESCLIYRLVKSEVRMSRATQGQTFWVMSRMWMGHVTNMNEERWRAGVETQKNVRGEIGGWGRVPFNEPYAPLLSTIYDGA